MELWILCVAYVLVLGASDACNTRVDDIISLGAGSSVGQLIKSNGFPDVPYSSFSDECWTIRTSDNNSLRISFKDFAIESLYDKVFVYDDSYANNARLIAELSGTVGQDTYYANSGYLHVEFTSDGSSQLRGWQACVCVVDATCSCPWEIPGNTSTSDHDWTGSITGWVGGITTTIVIIIGSVVGGIILLCVVVGIAIGFCVNRRNRRRRTTNAAMTPVPAGGYPVPQQGYANQAQGSATPAGGYQVQQGVGYPSQLQYVPAVPPVYTTQNLAAPGPQQNSTLDTRVQKEVDTGSDTTNAHTTAM